MPLTTNVTSPSDSASASNQNRSSCALKHGGVPSTSVRVGLCWLLALLALVRRNRAQPWHQPRHHLRISSLCLVAVLLPLAKPAWAADYYVATDGSDGSATGSIEAPLATLQEAIDRVSAGDTVYIRGGVYNIQTPATSGAGILVAKSGTGDGNRISFFAYEDEVPVFDFSNLVISTSTYTHGFLVTGSWLHFRGLEIRNVPMNMNSNNGMQVEDASNNIFESLNLHHNNGTGLFISRGTGGHLVLNCDSHDNYDPTGRQGNGQNADGFGCHYQESGPTTIFRGCRAWWNSDDGYDLISQEVPVVIEDSWAMRNGYADSGNTVPPDGNGNGFKAGSSKTGIRHVIRRNVAWANRASGFYANHSSGGNDWYNNTSFDNGTQYNMLASTWDAAGNRTDGVILTGALAHVMRNNIGFPDDNTNMQGVDMAANTWDLGISPSNGDFLSVDDAATMGPREADGSLPNSTFLKLAMDSAMIDQGEDVGLAFSDAAPDLGAYEYGAAPPPGMGGAGGSGASGSAGALGMDQGQGGATSSGGSEMSQGGMTMQGMGGASPGGTASVPLGDGGQANPGVGSGQGGVADGGSSTDTSQAAGGASTTGSASTAAEATDGVAMQADGTDLTTNAPGEGSPVLPTGSDAAAEGGSCSFQPTGAPAPDNGAARVVLLGLLWGGVFSRRRRSRR